jgi:hypothetical protein
MVVIVLLQAPTSLDMRKEFQVTEIYLRSKGTRKGKAVPIQAPRASGCRGSQISKQSALEGC